MHRKRVPFLTLLLYSILLTIVLFGCGKAEPENYLPELPNAIPSESEEWTMEYVIPQYPMLVSYPLDEMVAESYFIVLGTVTDAQSYVNRNIFMDGYEEVEYFRELTVDVQEYLKGPACDPFLFRDQGGVFEGTLYTYPSFAMCQVGGTYLLFLREDGTCTTAFGERRLLKDDMFFIECDMLPDSLKDQCEKNGMYVPASEYLEYVRQAVEQESEKANSSELGAGGEHAQ